MLSYLALQFMTLRQPGEMAGYLFSRALRLHLDSAVRADEEKQNHTGWPREWYIYADFACDECKQEFSWTAAEQKVWFEEYRFHVDSVPRHCKACQRLKHLRKEYDANVAAAKAHGTPDQKKRIVEIVRELDSAFSGIPVRMAETRLLLERQLDKQAEQNGRGNSAAPRASP